MPLDPQQVQKQLHTLADEVKADPTIHRASSRLFQFFTLAP